MNKESNAMSKKRIAGVLGAVLLLLLLVAGVW